MTIANNKAGIVYLLDDDLKILTMLQTLVACIDVEVRAFSSPKEFLAAYRPTPHACLVSDVRMPGINGIELQQRLRAIDAALPIIFLTGIAEVSVAVQAMKHGAFDFLEKPFSAQALLGTIQSALDSNNNVKRLGHETKEARLALLTPKERSVVRHVVDGKSSREIAELLDIGVRSVENYRSRIMEKLHVKSMAELIKLCL